MKVRGLICRSLLLSAVALLTTTATTMAFAAEGPFHVEHTWQVGGEGGWDYIAVDPQTNLLYITRGDHVQVIEPGEWQAGGLTFPGCIGRTELFLQRAEMDTSATAAATRWWCSIARRIK